MARYPGGNQEWAHRPYGNDELAWDEAKRLCRATLYAWAAAGRYGTYGEVARAVTAIGWPDGPHTHQGRQMGMLLGQVTMDELDRVEDRPILSALAVSQEEQMPSSGFWSLVRDVLGLPVGPTEDARLEFWVREFKAACEYYGKPTA